MSELKQELINEINNYYTIYFMQLYRVQYNPTYVEKSILSKYVDNIKNFFLERVNNLEESLKQSLDGNLNSYYGWSTDFYQGEYDKRIKLVEDLKHRISNTRDTKFLALDLSVDDEQINEEFSKFIVLPTNKGFLSKKDPNITYKSEKKSKHSKNSKKRR
jgi:hypothetical protein